MTFRMPPRWSLAGLVAQSGELDRPIAAGTYTVPNHIGLDGDNLKWDTPFHFRNPARDLLTRFVRLAEADGGKVLEFAREHGVLGICRHGLPASHNPEPSDIHPVLWPHLISSWCLPQRWVGQQPEEPLIGSGFSEPERWMYWEPIEAWRRFAADARAILNFAAELHNDRCGREVDWDTMFESLRPASAEVWFRRGRSDVERGKKDVWMGRYLLAEQLNLRLQLGNVRPTVVWGGVQTDDTKGPVALFQGEGLYGMIALQLAMAVSKSHGFAVCRECGTAYAPRRRPNLAQRNYCDSCRRLKVPERNATRAYRKRKREERGNDTPRS